MAQDENSKPEKWSTAYSWLCPYCQLSQPSGTLHVCAGSQRGEGAAAESNENNHQNNESARHGEDSALEWADTYQKYYKTGPRCPKCSIGTSNRLFNGLCGKCWKEEVMGIDTTAPEKADEITQPAGLRDQFAMAVLPFLIESELQSRSMPPNPRRPSPIPAAEGAYKWADAMLEARKK